MKNKCKICGAPCRSKYCSQKCCREARRRQYRAKHPFNQKFYVFYDKNDFVMCCGTAEDLVESGFFSDKKYVKEFASKIKRNVVKGNVVILPLIMEN